MTEFENRVTLKKYFDSQCTTGNNNCALTSTLNHLTDNELSSFNISSSHLDPNKAQK